MFYLKYRPQNLDDLDNKSVREQLTRLLKSGTIPHAFLFSGPKGTGKTSTARIVAKVLNAEANAKGEVKTLSPDPTEDNIIAITKGTSADVIEMDAASNRKIDDIRSLMSDLKFAPLTSKYKIYIIDEVHMLTKEAFNALLKSLEEPPAHTIFILATTEAEALPRTITSRCMTIRFSHAQKSDIVSMIQRICVGEKIKLSDEVAEFIADNADGSFRDATKILEQLTLLGIEEAMTVDDVKKVLGHVLLQSNLLEIIAHGEIKETMEWIEKAAEQGSNMRILIENVLQELHALLLIKSGVEKPLTGTSSYSDDITKNITLKKTARLISLLQRAHNEIKYSPIPVLPLELAIVEYFNTA